MAGKKKRVRYQTDPGTRQTFLLARARAKPLLPASKIFARGIFVFNFCGAAAPKATGSCPTLRLSTALDQDIGRYLLTEPRKNATNDYTAAAIRGTHR